MLLCDGIVINLIQFCYTVSESVFILIFNGVFLEVVILLCLGMCSYTKHFN